MSFNYIQEIPTAAEIKAEIPLAPQLKSIKYHYHGLSKEFGLV